MTFTARVSPWLIRWLLSGLGFLSWPAVAQTLPVADFFKPDEFSDVSMSPSGKHLALTVPRQDGRLSLAVIDVADLTKVRVVAAYRDADVIGVEWVNDDRLIYRISDRQESPFRQRGVGLYAVDVVGGGAPRTLVRLWTTEVFETGTHIQSRVLSPLHALYSVLRDGSPDVLVVEYVFSEAGEFQRTVLKRLDTTTGLVRGLSQGAPDGVYDWTVDRSGEPRVAVTLKAGREALYWKVKPGANWVKVSEEEAYGRGVPSPLFVDAGNRAYMRATPRGEDTVSLVTYDLSDAEPKATPVLSAAGFDVGGDLVVSRLGGVIGARYLTEAVGTQWFDTDMRKLQERIDALLPGTNNLIDCGTCEERGKVLVTSTSDRQPSAYYLFDSATGKFQLIAQARPWIKPKTMAERDMVRIAARDGLSLPVHVTKPLGAKGPQPTVVLVHGGPRQRGGYWTWDAQSQFLASRGYVVIEPEFRGSLGFGWKHDHAGWKQWGLGMQDDVADATQWVIKQGIADPKRICIAGASYGGYATLMGLIRNPELYRCGVEWAGVTDIDLIYSASWSDTSDDYLRYGMPRLVGDRVADAAQLAATSPIKLVDKLKQPLLMAYGGIDRRVPIDHGTQFRDAVRKTNSQVEWVVYPEEGHGWRLPATNIDFWGRVEKFLDKNLKSAP